MPNIAKRSLVKLAPYALVLPLISCGDKKDSSSFSPISPSTIADLCLNIEGTQSEIPQYVTRDQAGNCDLCANLEGMQTGVPDNYTRDTNNWACTPRPDITYFLSGAGDIGMCGSENPEKTAKILDGLPGVIFTAGDNAQGNGTENEYTACYGPNWGRHLSRTRPAPGNHDFATNRTNYFNYFGANAGPYGLGYYSYDLGEWHIISLNSVVSGSEMLAEVAWLRDDLSNRKAKCTAAYWHHPLFTSGSSKNSFVKPLWDTLYEFGADLVVNGHEHFYERFDLQDPNGRFDEKHGIQQFGVGTGGYSLYDFGNAPNSLVRDKSFGVLQLELRGGSYSWKFITPDGTRDFGSANCR